MAALVPVPVDTTPSSIWTSSALVAGSMARRVGDAGAATTPPDGVTVALTRRGATNIPPLATAL